MASINISNIKESEFNNITPFFKNYKTREINDIDTVVLHWTAGGSVDGAIRTLLKKGYGYHFLISKDAKVFQGAELRSRIGHAGNSYGPNGKNTNSTSIGISFAVPGKDENFTPNSEITKEMIDVCVRLILDVKRALPKLKWITGHHWVAPGRKVDPWYLKFEPLIRDLNKAYEAEQRILNLTPLGSLTAQVSSEEFKIWKAGYPPFPNGLSNCRCLEYTDSTKTNCKKATKGGCIGPGGESYSPQRVTSKLDDIVIGVNDLDDNLLGT